MHGSRSVNSSVIGLQFTSNSVQLMAEWGHGAETIRLECLKGLKDEWFLGHAKQVEGFQSYLYQIMEWGESG